MVLFIAIGLLLGTADEPAWTEPRTVATPGRVGGSASLADVNDDGPLDLVVPCADGDGLGQLAVHLGDGSGEFAEPALRASLSFPGRALRLAMGDVDGDGRLDAAVGHHDSYDVEILLGDGHGKFGPGHRVTMHNGDDPHTHSLVLADVDADSDLDILTSCADDNAIAIMLGDGGGGQLPGGKGRGFSEPITT